MSIFKKFDAAMKAEQDRTMAELKKTPAHKHLAFLLLAGLVGWGVVSCTAEPTEAELVEKAYFSSCFKHGEGIAIHNRTKVQSYKDEALTRYNDYLLMERQNPGLDVALCKEQYQAGMRVGHRKADRLMGVE